MYIYFLKSDRTTLKLLINFMLCEAESKVVVIALAHSSKQLVGAIERQKKSCIDTAG